MTRVLTVLTLAGVIILAGCSSNRKDPDPLVTSSGLISSQEQHFLDLRDELVRVFNSAQLSAQLRREDLQLELTCMKIDGFEALPSLNGLVSAPALPSNWTIRIKDSMLREGWQGGDTESNDELVFTKSMGSWSAEAVFQLTSDDLAIVGHVSRAVCVKKE